MQDILDKLKSSVGDNSQEIIQMLTEPHRVHNEEWLSFMQVLLFEATRKNMIFLEQYLIKAGADVNTALATDSGQKWSPLALAIHLKHIQSIELFLKNKGSLECVGPYGKTLEEVLLKKFENEPNDSSEFEEKLIAIWHRKYKKIVDSGGDLNAIPPKTYLNPLMVAAQDGKLVEVKALVQFKVNIHEQSQYKTRKKTPIMFAALNGHAAIVEYLISCGADVSQTTVPLGKDDKGKTILELIENQQGANFDIIRTLINTRLGKNDTNQERFDHLNKSKKHKQDELGRLGSALKNIEEQLVSLHKEKERIHQQMPLVQVEITKIDKEIDDVKELIEIDELDKERAIIANQQTELGMKLQHVEIRLDQLKHKRKAEEPVPTANNQRFFQAQSKRLEVEIETNTLQEQSERELLGTPLMNMESLHEILNTTSMIVK